MKPILQVNHLKKVFHQRGKRNVAAVNDVSFCLYPGEILGIVGESGSGKSTVAKLITRLEDVTDGQIILDGQVITHSKGTARKEIYEKIQMVFQNPVGSFDPRRTLGDGIGESLKNKGVSKAEIRAKVAELLEQCGLEPEYMDRYPHQVSGGQCQRAAIARALAVDPKVIICDEATSALDPQTTKAILELIKEINRDYGITVVVITHEMSVVQEICDKVAVLERGSLVETGTVEELFRNPKTDEARKLVFSGRTQIKEMKGKRLVRVTFREKSSFEPVIANLVLTYRTPVNILYADTKNINGQAQGEMILQLPELEEVADKMIQYLKEINMGVEELKEDVG